MNIIIKKCHAIAYESFNSKRNLNKLTLMPRLSLQKIKGHDLGLKVEEINRLFLQVGILLLCVA